MPSAWTTKPDQQHPERPGAPRPGARVATEPALAADPGQRRGVPGAGDRAEHAAGEQQRDEDRHRQVAAPAAAERVDDGGRAGTGQQDAERQGGDPPRHQRRPLARVVGDLGRLGDVGHLEAAVGGRGEQEGDRHPRRRESRAACSGRRRPARTAAAGRARRRASTAGAAPSGSRVRSERLPIHGLSTHVPRLGREHHQPGDAGGHAELVGQVVEQQQAGHRAERRRPDRAQRVAEVRAAGEPRSGRDGGHKIGTVLLSRP